MALSMATAIAQIRVLVAEVTGLSRVYAASETNANRLPNALNQLPCAIVIPGPDAAPYILSAGQHRHTYQVIVRIYESMSGDIGEAAAATLPMVDRVIEKFVGNVLLADADDSNPRANSCIYQDQRGLQSIPYSGVEYLAYEILLRVSEQASATPGAGA